MNRCRRRGGLGRVGLHLAGLLLTGVLLAGPASPPAPPGPEGTAGIDLPAAARHAYTGRPQPGAAPPGHASATVGFDATYYHLTLDLRFDPAYLYGRTRVAGRAAGRPLQVLTLDFSSTMQVDSVTVPGTGRRPFDHTDDVLRVTLPAPVPAGAPLAVDVFYQGTPAASADGFGTFVFGREHDGTPYAWTLSEPYGARGWWPSVDHPADKADSVRVTVTVPAGLRVGSNGLLVGQTRGNGTATYDWRSRYPIASYLVFLAAGRYDVYTQTYERPDSLAARWGPLRLPLLHYAYQGSNLYEGTYPASGWKRVVDVLPVLEGWFGPYPFAAEKYGHVQFTRGGGMEHQTMSSMGGSDLGLVTHELAHQWFGDLVTPARWPHLWLNEGFATYAELLYWHAAAGRYPGTYDQIFDLYYQRALAAEGPLVVADTADVRGLFTHARVYAKGGMVLHMLRGIVGDAPFRALLQAYTADEALRYGTARTADLQRVAEAVTGRDLDAFFRQWVTEGTGFPVYDVRWHYADAGAGYDVTVEVEQRQAPPASSVAVFEMPLTLVVETEAGTHSVTVQNDRRLQRYVVHTAARPVGVVLDPERWVLRGGSGVGVFAEDAEPAPARTAIRAVYPNPAAARLTVEVALAEAGPVQLALYDVLGRRLRLLVDEVLPAGPHTRTFGVEDLPAGAYLLRLTAAGRAETRMFTRAA